jgi:MarR family transcriptional regulator, organic hydroperoxide resistance regulator
MDRIESCISFVAGKAAQQIARRARERLAPHDVTPVQYAILRVLAERDGQSGAELSARLVIDSATITGLIDRLEGAGLVERQPDASDRRVNRTCLTLRARALQPALDAAMDALNADVAAELGDRAPELWETLRRLGQPPA